MSNDNKNTLGTTLPVTAIPVPVTNIKVIPEIVEEEPEVSFCWGCSAEIDPEICYCGSDSEDAEHCVLEYYTHAFTPVGCMCGYNSAAKEQAEREERERLADALRTPWDIL